MLYNLAVFTLQFLQGEATPVTPAAGFIAFDRIRMCTCPIWSKTKRQPVRSTRGSTAPRTTSLVPLRSSAVTAMYRRPLLIELLGVVDSTRDCRYLACKLHSSWVAALLFPLGSREVALCCGGHNRGRPATAYRQSCPSPQTTPTEEILHDSPGSRKQEDIPQFLTLCFEVVQNYSQGSIETRIANFSEYNGARRLPVMSAP
ncbi:hypothetical protein M430DRAFT_26506 [Amorphotheca resinae ATCC 22711]|uniref:Uncharacterized protein n=1 Tax=Amorphotheca resinae ATCC 22711 TaxID=857342 RepID=A0A2T3B5D5_AMORE|nr:hypothetical protein M430DRAFT_26506 [Amorphotheca resinae ATCC 22711]PSS21969.1 hypothetical protein M430DRAFT_26506 [Amorphotheca resinae ATCC 22711]